MTTCTRASQTKSRSSLTVVHQATSSPSLTSSLSADAGRSIPSRTNNAPQNEFSTTEQFSVLTKRPSQNPSDPTHHPPTFTELCSTCHGYKPAVDQTDYHSAVEAQRESGGHHHHGLPRALRRAISQLASSLNGKEYYRHVDKNGRRRLPVIRESEERSDLIIGDTNGGNNARTGADPGSLKFRESAGSLPLSDQSGEEGRQSERRRGRACTKRASERDSYQARNRPEYADEGSLSSHHNYEYFRPADVLCIPLQSGMFTRWFMLVQPHQCCASVLADANPFLAMLWWMHRSDLEELFCRFQKEWHSSSKRKRYLPFYPLLYAFLFNVEATP